MSSRLAILIADFDEAVTAGTGWERSPILWLIERNAEEIRDETFAVEWAQSNVRKFPAVGAVSDIEEGHVAVLKLAKRIDSTGGAPTAQRDALIALVTKEADARSALSSRLCSYGLSYGGTTRTIVNGVLLSSMTFTVYAT